MDGTITDLSEREKCVRSFQENDLYDTFLLTTQVCAYTVSVTVCYSHYSQTNQTFDFRMCFTVVYE